MLMPAMFPPEAADTPLDAERRQRLADLLVELARAIDPEVAAVLPPRLDADPGLAAVKSVMLREELEVLDRLHETIADPAQLAGAVSRVLPEAITLSGASDERLIQSLTPALVQATQATIRKDPGTLVNVLYPVMGSAIRKAIAESMNDRLQGLNEALRHAFSLRGLRWRLEALRSGSSFGDVVLKHTLVFRVEHLFLIHRSSGLLLEHVAAENAAARDPQLVSAMLTAIQDFVRDSFDAPGEDSAIDSLRLGDLLLWCEAGPQAYLAAVIRGDPPASLRALMRETVRSIHEDLGGPLENYDGDSAPLGELGLRLQACVREQVQQPVERRRAALWTWAIPFVLVLLAGWWLIGRYLEGRRFDAYVDALRAEPGIVVTDAARSHGRWLVGGLRDPLAADPQALLLSAGLAPETVVGNWEPYVTLKPTIVLKRLRESLPALPAVELSLEGDVIHIRGSAPPYWVDRINTLVRALPAGAPTVDLSKITGVEDPEYLRLREQIQSVHIYFDSGAPDPAKGQEATLDQLAQDTRTITDVARRLGFSVRLSLIGHADTTGNQTDNLGISIARAEVVRSLLRSRGIAPELMSVRGTGTLEPLAAGETAPDLSSNRVVTFTIDTSE
ncbi:MAG: OmpA family protein [Panacagrimonas sp.]